MYVTQVLSPLQYIPLLPPCSQLLQETHSKEIEQFQLHKMHQFVLFHKFNAFIQNCVDMIETMCHQDHLLTQ